MDSMNRSHPYPPRRLSNLATCPEGLRAAAGIGGSPICGLELCLTLGPENNSVTLFGRGMRPLIRTVHPLETTARAFAAGVFSCLPASKTISFEFRIAGSSLSSLISAPPNGFDVGASHKFEAGSVIWALPQIRRDVSVRPLPHHFFTVYIGPQLTDTVIGTLRSVGIQEAARQLAMFAVENITKSPRRLMLEEHRGFYLCRQRSTSRRRAADLATLPFSKVAKAAQVTTNEQVRALRSQSMSGTRLLSEH
ncbi:uncharacterized protein N7500_005469 [Penicillium coprophilum]|uniref:uncharacterized protein n=1 Tax=Penicillium coprophilum TaxID=36646 RepID=UPI0023A2B6EB|nr:uncharacterized protein N7500_005469 [Penicillium coprophilum]KAJ5163639.1 hypothetical protein N7500_005469 [Penicillium coprophilum]